MASTEGGRREFRVGIDLGIRRSCRWFAQRGTEACGVCPIVVHTRRVPAEARP